MNPRNPPPDGPVSVRTIRDAAGLAAVRDAWRTLQTHPWSDVDYFAEHLASQEGFVRPHVLVLERGGTPIGIVAAALRRETLSWRVGSFTLWRSRARVLWVGGGGVMGEDSQETARAIVDELAAALGRGEADAAYLHQLDSASALPALARDRWARSVGGWVLELPETFEAYLKSRTRNVRRNLKRYSELLERELGPDVRIACYAAPEDLDRLVEDSETVARLTYHRGMGVGFQDTPELRAFFAHALRVGWMRGYVMYAKERPIAFWHGLAYGRTFYTRDTGYDPEFARLRPGNYLLTHVIEEHCRTRLTERFDYGVMELEYKRQFGTRRYERTSAYVFGRRPKGLFLGGMRTVSGLADRTARKVLGGRARQLARKLGSLGRPELGGAGAQDDAQDEGEPPRARGGRVVSEYRAARVIRRLDAKNRIMRRPGNSA